MINIKTSSYEDCYDYLVGNDWEMSERTECFFNRTLNVYEAITMKEALESQFYEDLLETKLGSVLYE